MHFSLKYIFKEIRYFTNKQGNFHPACLFHPTRLLDMRVLNVSCNLRKNKKRKRDVTQWKFTHMIESWIGNHSVLFS